MTWPRTAAGRVLLAWACALGLWLFAEIASITGPTWTGLGIGLGVAGGLSLIAWWAFRRSTARPFPSAGVSGWLARRPPW
jgi:hypothetical protein